MTASKSATIVLFLAMTFQTAVVYGQHWDAVLTEIINNNSGNVGIGDFTTGFFATVSHQLTIRSSDARTLRLHGPGSFGSGARVEFGAQSGNVYIGEDITDSLIIRTSDAWR